MSPLYKYRVAGQGRRAPARSRGDARRRAARRPGRCSTRPGAMPPGRCSTTARSRGCDEHAFRMTSAEPNLRWFQDNAIGLRSGDRGRRPTAIAALALQGPTSRDDSSAALPTRTSPRLKYFRLTAAKLRGIPVTISRTGYTGDLGYEIWLDAARRAAGVGCAHRGRHAVRHHARRHARARRRAHRGGADAASTSTTCPREQGARSTSQTSSPFELDLGWTVDLDKEHFVGKPALAAEAQRGPRVAVRRHRGRLGLAGAALRRASASRRALPAAAWRTSVPLYASGEQAGYATSGVLVAAAQRSTSRSRTCESRWAEPGTRWRWR